MPTNIGEHFKLLCNVNYLNVLNIDSFIYEFILKNN